MRMSKNVMYIVVAALTLIYLIPSLLTAIVAAADTTGVDTVITSISPIVQIIAFISPIGLLFLLWSARERG